MQFLPVESRGIMERQSQQQAGTYLFGEKSKIANWILNHPLQIAAGGTLASCLVTIGDNTMLLRGLMIIPAYWFGLALLVRLLCRNLCYQVEINTLSERIKFFRCFNKGVVEAPIGLVEFRFDKHFAAIYGEERFTIFNEYMVEIAQVIWPEKQIKFSRGIYARYMKRRLKKNAATSKAGDGSKQL